MRSCRVLKGASVELLVHYVAIQKKNIFPKFKERYVASNLKEPGQIASDFFKNFVRFWYQKKVHIFLITSGEFYR